MGGRRLRLLEERLADDTVILGVDEHTACVLDLSTDTATVRGSGRLTIRINGVEWYVQRGETVPSTRCAGTETPPPGRAGARSPPVRRIPPPPAPSPASTTPFVDAVDQRVAAAEAVLEGR
jgi:hypothetical protein